MLVVPLIRKAIKTDRPRYDGPTGSPWRYMLTSDFGYSSHHLHGVTFENRWVCIKYGNIVIREGYAWDGCSPCICVLGLFYLGPPDGAQHLGVPATYYASLVHDVLCQWRHEIPITKHAVTKIFQDLLEEVRFPLRRLYVAAVNCFGPQVFAGNGP